MNLRTRLSRSNGYRELGMFDESINELEAIEFGEDWGKGVWGANYEQIVAEMKWKLSWLCRATSRVRKGREKDRRVTRYW